MKTVYLSGAISKNPNFKENFRKAREQWEEAGYTVIDPSYLIDVFPNGTHEQYMKICLELLKMADIIYMMEGWENSKGAIIEYGYALSHEIQTTKTIWRKII